ncbi:MAG: DNA repair protein RecN [Chloroflexi bacterium RBG_16_48_8]|nr:MAG: DNA repair protein RecN [Chloroflexi bacterium RBG_16_48_8]
MLTELKIRDYAIIDELTLEIGSGLIIFTGETGTGKSIIIDAVELFLGGRAETVSIRTGADTALIEGTFKLLEPVRQQVGAILEREGLLDDPDYVTLGREVRREGRNICRINGRMVPLSLLREIGELLVDVHGQSEHLSLLRVPEHLGMIDRFAQVGSLLQQYSEIYCQFQHTRGELATLRKQERDSVQRADLLAFQINEIQMASLKPGEDHSLLEERIRLANAEQLAELAQQAILSLDEEVDSHPVATDLIGRAVHSLENLAKVDPSMAQEHMEAQVLLETASDLARRLRDYQERIDNDPKRLDQVEERLEVIRSLQRKYGEVIPEIIAYAEKARMELDAITHAEERMRLLETQEEEQLKRLAALGLELSNARCEAGSRLTGEIDAELSDLRMAGAKFGVDQSWEDSQEGVPVEGRRVAFTSTGLDRIEFLVAPNPGEGLKPLAKIASGGETTRLMLALKNVLADADRMPTLIFDEIDQGIGGRVGAVVGSKLWKLSRDHQVLCITHLPQLAAFGDQHFRVEKRIEGGRTTTVVHALDPSQRISELALMLGGESEVNIESAQALLQHAAETIEKV